MIKDLKKIDLPYYCLLSSTVVGMVTLILGPLGPIGTMGSILGLTGELIESVQKKRKNKNEQIELQTAFLSAIKSAWELTKDEASHSERKIIEELERGDSYLQIKLSEIASNIDNTETEYEFDIAKLMRDTDAFRKQYCTKKDAINIVNKFDKNLNICIIGNESLSHLYLLSNTYHICDKLKYITEILENQNIKLDGIGYSIESMSLVVHRTDSNFQMIINLCRKCVIDLIFIIIATTIFWTCCSYNWCNNGNTTLIITAPLCMIISEILTHLLKQQFDIDLYIKKLEFGDILNTYNSDKAREIIIKYVLPVIITVSLFWIIYKATSFYSDGGIFAKTIIMTAVLGGSNIFSIYTKNIIIPNVTLQQPSLGK